MKDFARRNSTVELFRCFFMYLIVVHHVFVHGVDHNEDIFLLTQNLNSWFSFEVFMLGKAGVVGFIFISGYYGINFSAKKVLYCFLNACFYLFVLQLLLGHGLKQIDVGLIHPYDTWWFVRDYFVLLIISPLLNEGWKQLQNQIKIYVILCLLYIFCIGQARYDSHDMMVMIVVYLFAKFMREYSDTHNYMLPYIYIVSLISLFVYCMVPLLLSKYGLDSISLGWVSHNNFFLILAVGGGIIFADNSPFHNKYLNIISTHLLAIYLITDYPSLWHFHKTLLPMMFDSSGYGICLALCIVCIMIDFAKTQLLSWGTKLMYRIH